MLCVLAKLSDDATEKLAAIQRSAFHNHEEFKPLHGHITLASYEGNDETGFIQTCKDLLKDIRSFDIFYEKIEEFNDPYNIVTKPGPSAILEAMHQRIADEYNDALNKWTKMGAWNPHTSLYFAPDTSSHVFFQKMSESFVPFSASVCRIEFSRVLESGYVIIDFMDLPVC